jgi:hypothetical protein
MIAFVARLKQEDISLLTRFDMQVAETASFIP